LITIVILAAIAVLTFVFFKIILPRIKPAPGARRRSANNAPGNGQAAYNSSQTLSKGRELGFSDDDMALINGAAAEAGIEPPYKYFWSTTQLDLVLKALTRVLVTIGKLNEASSQALLGTLLEHRKTLELNKANSSKQGLSSTKEIAAGQPVQVILNEIGIFSTQVTKNVEHLEILTPIVADLPPTFSFVGRNLNVFFKRKGDGEYSFNSTASKEVECGETGDFVLYLPHSDTLSRSQKRRSIRVQTWKDAHIYPVDDIGNKSFSEGKKCTLNDISDMGCSAIIDGRSELPPTLIIQFNLCNQLLSLYGERRTIQFNRQKNISLLHVEFQSLPPESKNLLLSFIFGIIEETNSHVGGSSDFVNTTAAVDNAQSVQSENVAVATSAATATSAAPATPVVTPLVTTELSEISLADFVE
jgi:c-di-GMP-binding flagellar brake protein YcgR